MKPIFTNLSNLAFTVGVDIPVSRETWLNDLRPSLNNDFKIDINTIKLYRHYHEKQVTLILLLQL